MKKIKIHKLNKEEFFKTFDISEDYFISTGLDWDILNEIYADYCKIVPLLEKEAEHIVSKLIDVPLVHSVRRRVKEPSHLIEKIIRKGKKYHDLNINVTNYIKIVTDLIGIRVLHLFKDDWINLHKNITDIWETKEIPQLNVRHGDYNMNSLKEQLKDIDCEIIIREYGYRSVHYLIGAHISKDKETFIEIQARTVFEEAWSEIDHIIRYPYDKDNPILAEYLAIFNRIAGSADEMGMFIKKLKAEVGNNDDKLGNNSKRELDLKFK